MSERHYDALILLLYAGINGLISLHGEGAWSTVGAVIASVFLVGSLVCSLTAPPWSKP